MYAIMPVGCYCCCIMVQERHTYMFNHHHYVPILKWKMGEYQALNRLTDQVKDGLTPLLEIPPVGFDHETGQDRESADAHLGDFGRRLKSKWPGRSCFVDLKYLP